MSIFKKGFRIGKKPNKKVVQQHEAIKAFLAAYRDVCTEHKLQLVPIITHKEHGGSEPDFKVIEFLPPPEPQLKGWGDAEEENLKTRKVCRHLNENGENCKHCGVRIADQDESGTGVTESYVVAKEEKPEMAEGNGGAAH